MNPKNQKQHLLDFTQDELSKLFLREGIEKYRASQIFDWIYRKRIIDFSAMSNLGKSLRAKLTERFIILQSRIIANKISDDGTQKLLLNFGNDLQIETVLIPAENRLTACISTQSGCPVGCKFCATGRGKFSGNLTAGQIVEQLLQLQIIADEYSRRIDHVVVMGMGEPLLNYDNTIRAVRLINAPTGFNIGARKITVSTVGIPEKIHKLANEQLQLNLAISLHHTVQEKREELIPLAKKYPLEQIISAAEKYFELTHREITLEYLLLKDINITGNDAQRLATIAKRLRANVNLIPYNMTSDSDFKAPTNREIQAFLRQLRNLKVNAHIRTSKGSDIEAACGQLRKAYSKTTSR